MRGTERTRTHFLITTDGLRTENIEMENPKANSTDVEDGKCRR